MTPAELTVAEVLEAATNALSNWDDLTTESEGVYGLHLNGDPAPWSDLIAGGRFEEWSAGIEQLRALVAAATKARQS